MLSKDENQDLIKHLKFIEESSELIGSDNYFNNIKSIIPEYITSFKEIKLNKNKKLNDGDNFNEFNKLTCIFLKIQNADLINIRHILKSDMIKLKYKTLEIQNSVKEIEREMTIVLKEKKEIFTEKSNIENEIFKYRNHDESHLLSSQSQSHQSDYSGKSTSIVPSIHKNYLKDKEKKLKDLRLLMKNLEKKFIDGKKLFIIKKNKNDLCIQDNNNLSESYKQKILIVEQIKLEMEQMKIKMDLRNNMKDKYRDINNISNNNSQSTNISSNNSSNNKQQIKKGVFGFVKSLFKK